jgi:hypothetical protein
MDTARQRRGVRDRRVCAVVVRSPSRFGCAICAAGRFGSEDRCMSGRQVWVRGPLPTHATLAPRVYGSRRSRQSRRIHGCARARSDPPTQRMTLTVQPTIPRMICPRSHQPYTRSFRRFGFESSVLRCGRSKSGPAQSRRSAPLPARPGRCPRVVWSSMRSRPARGAPSRRGPADFHGSPAALEPSSLNPPGDRAEKALLTESAGGRAPMARRRHVWRRSALEAPPAGW